MQLPFNNLKALLPLGLAAASLLAPGLATAQTSLEFATYFGGNGQEEQPNMATDAQGNLYVAFPTSSSGLATAGAHQTIMAGSTGTFGSGDILLSKFDAAGTLLWATYYGGLENEFKPSVAIGPMGEVYLGGSTYSDSGIATAGAHQSTLQGGDDFFLAKFTPIGGLTWATYFGGAGSETGGVVAVDASGNAYLLGLTYSDSLATPGAYQASPADTNPYLSDGLLAKFNSAGTLQWATYHGGDNGDEPLALRVDGSGNPYVAGRTFSDTGLATTGAHQSAKGGQADAYLARFDANGNLLWCTYYGGLQDEEGYGIAIRGNRLYLTGGTQSTTAIATSGAHQDTLGGSGDAYLACFNSLGVRQWGTYLGGIGQDLARSVDADALGRVHIVGASDVNSTGIATAGAFQDTVAGYINGFLATFDAAGSRLEGTYFGGEFFDFLTSVSSTSDGHVYVAGLTYSSTGIATAGAHQDTLVGGNDIYLASILVSTPVALAAPGIAYGCGTLQSAGLATVQVQARAGATQYRIELSQGGVPFDTISQATRHFALNALGGIALLDNTTYGVRAQVDSAGFSSAWSSLCTLTTLPLQNTSKLRAPDCGRTNFPASGGYAIANPASGATAYSFRIHDSLGNFISTYTNINPLRRKLTFANAVMSAGNTYQIVVQTTVGGTNYTGDTCTVGILNPGARLGMDEATALSAYPNPTADAWTITVEEATVATLYDMTGRAVWSGTLNGTTQIGAGLKAGLYNLRTAEGAQVKLVKVQ